MVTQQTLDTQETTNVVHISAGRKHASPAFHSPPYQTLEEIARCVSALILKYPYDRDIKKLGRAVMTHGDALDQLAAVIRRQQQKGGN